MNESKVTKCRTTGEMVKKAASDGVEIVWDRLEKQLPQCRFGQLGICCTNCAMGPCRINPFGGEPAAGVCGATADVIVARNLLVDIATGAAAHSDHGRDMLLLLQDIASGAVSDYGIKDECKLKALAVELGVTPTSDNVNDMAGAVACCLLEKFGSQKSEGIAFPTRVPEKRMAVWKKSGSVPRGVDREIVESLHRTHIGVDNDAASLLMQGVRTSLADGWGGSMIATEVSDIIFGTPSLVRTRVDLGVLREDMVNIIVHGHELILSEMVALAASDKRLVARAEALGAKGINVCGMCCTGTEMLARRGIPVAGNFLQQELAVITGAVEAMVVDVQCVFPSIAHLASCYHTRFISTSEKAKFTGATHVPFNKNDAYGTAVAIVESAVENFSNRRAGMVYIPEGCAEATAGFSVEVVLKAFGGSVAPLVAAIEQGRIRGVAGVVGCNNPKTVHDGAHLELVRELIRHDVLVVSTGCNAIACAKNGLLMPDAVSMAGDGLAKFCREYAIPPVLHMGSCVDISRILTVAAAMAEHVGCDISDLPVAGGAPEWMSQKAVSIATYLMSSGIQTVLGVVPQVLGSEKVAGILCDAVRETLGAAMVIESDGGAMAEQMLHHIDMKRSQLFSGFKVLELETVRSPRAASLKNTGKTGECNY